MRIGDEMRIVGTDTLLPYLNFSTMNDGTQASMLFTSEVRQVCWNTTRFAIEENAGKARNGMNQRITHRSVFDPAAITASMESYYAGLKAVVEQAKLLAQTPVRMPTAEQVVFDLFNAKRSDAVKANPKRDIRNSTGYGTILGLFSGRGMGSTLPGVKGTAWGLLNAVTEYVDHHVTAKTDSHRWESAMMGGGNEFKNAARDALVTLATTAD